MFNEGVKSARKVKSVKKNVQLDLDEVEHFEVANSDSIKQSTCKQHNEKSINVVFESLASAIDYATSVAENSFIYNKEEQCFQCKFQEKYQCHAKVSIDLIKISNKEQKTNVVRFRVSGCPVHSHRVTNEPLSKTEKQNAISNLMGRTFDFATDSIQKMNTVIDQIETYKKQIKDLPDDDLSESPTESSGFDTNAHENYNDLRTKPPRKETEGEEQPEEEFDLPETFTPSNFEAETEGKHKSTSSERNPNEKAGPPNFSNNIANKKLMEEYDEVNTNIEELEQRIIFFKGFAGKIFYFLE